MRVLHVAQALSRNFGGVQTVVHELAEAEARVGLAVDVVSTNVDAPRGCLGVPRNCFVDQAGVRFRYSSVQFRPLLFSRDFAQFVRRNLTRYDIVHVHGLYRFPTTYTAYQARHQGVPFIVSPHGSLDPYLYRRSSRSVWLKRLYERWFELPNLRSASAIHYTTDEERNLVGFLGLRTSSFVAPNGLDWDRYRNLPSRGRLRKSLGLGAEPVVLFLGRLHFKKGLDLLVAAFHALTRDIPSARLLIVGPDHDEYGRLVRGWVRQYGLERAVHFVGPLHADDVVQAYVDADVFALPSYTENFGLTVAEAMACRLPVVISDQVNIHAQVARARGGLVTPCSADAVGLALKSLLLDPERRRTMGTQGRSFVEQHFAWSKVVHAFTQEYERVIERHRLSTRTQRVVGNGVKVDSAVSDRQSV